MRQTLGSPVLAPTAGESRGLEWEAKGEGGGRRRRGVKWGEERKSWRGTKNVDKAVEREMEGGWHEKGRGEHRVSSTGR